MSFERATQDDHTREIARLHQLIERIQTQASAMQQAVYKLPEAEATALGEQADELRHTADALLDKIEELEPTS